MVLAAADARTSRPIDAPDAASALHTVLNASPDCLILIERDGTVSFISDNGRCAMSLDADAILTGTDWTSLYPEDARDSLDRMLRRALSGETCQSDVTVEDADGAPSVWHFTLSPIEGPQGTVDRVLSTSRPVRAIDSSDLRIRESNHRIKNALSSISSLLRMQTRNVEDEAARQTLQRASERILAISDLHGHIQVDNDRATVPAQAYLGRIAAGLAEAMGQGRISLLRRIEPMDLTPSQATALGLILSELVTNAVSHGLGDRQEGGLVFVEFGPDGEGQGRLSVADSGSGWPPGFDFKSDRNMGGRIVDLYARSLQGAMETSPGISSGARLTVTFPL